MRIKNSRLSRNSVKPTRTKSQKDGESEVADLETNLNQLDLGDHESEASLFDPDLSEFDQRDDNQTPHLDEFIQSTEYIEFTGCPKRTGTDIFTHISRLRSNFSTP